MLEIPGDYLEGGGAILRVATGLAAVTGTPIHIFNIRRGRPNPGLQAQHLEGLKAVAALCAGELEGAEAGSEEVSFTPGKIRPMALDVTIRTAGSVGLLFQALSLPASQADGPVEIRVRGGATFGKWAPPLLASQTVLLEMLKTAGYRADIDIARHGFYPTGGSDVRIVVHPWKPSPLDLTTRGSVTHIGGLSVASSDLARARVAERQASAAEQALKRQRVRPFIRNAYSDAACPGSGIVLWAATSTGMIIGADALGERGKAAEDVGKEAALSLERTLNSYASTDDHLSDQLLPFLGLAGSGSLTAPQLTMHAKTNIWLIEKFLPVTFSVRQREGNVLITCVSERHGTEKDKPGKQDGLVDKVDQQ